VSITSDLIANIVAAAHIGYFLLVGAGCVAIVVGAVQGWKWVRNPWFRLCHLAAVYVVIIEGVLNVECPLLYRTRKSMFLVHSQLGRDKDSASLGQSPDASGLWVEAVGSAVVLRGTRSV
jgi:hypothetical protein